MVNQDFKSLNLYQHFLHGIIAAVVSSIKKKKDSQHGSAHI
jgi:hypothetical protein